MIRIESAVRKILLSATLVLLAASQGRADLIVNGSFETFTFNPAQDNAFPGFIRYFGPPFLANNTGITGWNITGTNGGIQNSVDLVSYAAFGTASHGNGLVWLDMEGSSSGVINQSFATSVGQIYELSFLYGNNFDASTTPKMNVLLTGASTLVDQDVTHFGSTQADLKYDTFTQIFIADSTTSTLQFKALTNTGFGIALDAVSVRAVPEPSAIVLLSLGVVGIAGFRLRRRKAARELKAQA